jgi:Xaa-Pro aminopeptidase
MDEQAITERASNRSQRPDSQAFRDFIGGQWADSQPLVTEPHPAAAAAAQRRAALAAKFPGERLVFPAGSLKTRSNDCDYRFRPHSAFAHLTGLGVDREPDAVLVLHPLPNPSTATKPSSPDSASDQQTGLSSQDQPTHQAVLYFRPASGKDTPEFYADSRYGEFWVGRRATLEEVQLETGIETAHLDQLPDALSKDVGPGQVQLRVIEQADSQITNLVEAIRHQAGFNDDDFDPAKLTPDEHLAEAASEARLIKDDHEIGQMRQAIAATIKGFERVVRALPEAIHHPRGERVIEAAFETGARIDGNGTGYDTIVGSGNHATTLHWIENTGPVRPGDLILVDAGIEAESLYTADITRTLPVSGRYTDVQRRIYQAVVDAADAAFAAAQVGRRFREVHEAAMVVIAQRLAEWGLLPVTAEQALCPDGQQHRRWMVHGTSHHLGIDVHDCAAARAELYIDAKLEPGMVFTIEPGLYFKSEDLAVPPEYRGIGARCEDDILITERGPENLSVALPRHPHDIETWMAGLCHSLPANA